MGTSFCLLLYHAKCPLYTLLEHLVESGYVFYRINGCIYPVFPSTKIPDKALLDIPPIEAQSKIWSLLVSISKAVADVLHIQYALTAVKGYEIESVTREISSPPS